MKEFLKQEWRTITPLLFFLIIFSVGYYEYKQYKAVPMQTIKQVTPDEVAKSLIGMGVFKNQTDANRVTERIIVREQAAPDYTFTTKTQADADKQANQLAKNEKADYILKKSETANDGGAITNKYFGVHTERNHQIQLGVTVTDSQAYFSVGIQRDNLSVMLHTKNFKQVNGATLMYTVKKF